MIASRGPRTCVEDTAARVRSFSLTTHSNALSRVGVHARLRERTSAWRNSVERAPADDEDCVRRL
eukprot:828866-Pleurochrysis_carterae.AAC.1